MKYTIMGYSYAVYERIQSYQKRALSLKVVLLSVASWKFSIAQVDIVNLRRNEQMLIIHVHTNILTDCRMNIYRNSLSCACAKYLRAH